jgi:hypothetical protein
VREGDAVIGDILSMVLGANPTDVRDLAEFGAVGVARSAEAKSFAQQMRGRILALKQAGPKPSAPKPAPRPSSGPRTPEPPYDGPRDSDEIPF